MTTVIDCHAHLEPRMLDVPDALRKMDAAGVDKVALIPAMNDLIPKTPDALLSVVRTLMRRKSTRPMAELIHRATFTREGKLRLKGETIDIFPRPDNETVANVLEAHPERFIGWIFLNPRADPHVLDTLDRWRSIEGFVGVKLHPHWHDYKTELLDPLLLRCEELRLPVLIHLGFRRRGDFRAIAGRYPGLTVISAHAGFPFYDDLWAYRGAYRNLHVDLSSPYINEQLARDAVATMGPERCLYGTDAPYGFPDENETYDYGEIRGWVERLPNTESERELVLGGNFLRMLSEAGMAV